MFRKSAQYFLLALFLLLFCGCGGHGGGGGSAEFISASSIPFRVETVVAGAAFPVSLAFLPDGRMLYLELTTGRVRVMDGDHPADGAFASVEIAGVSEPQVFGLAVDPQYSENNFIYIAHVNPESGFAQVTRVRVNEDGEDEHTVILTGLPGGGHSGGRIVFDADDRLYVSTGDGGQPSLAQNTNSLGGKILRIERDGSVPENNPIADSPIYAMGFRNVFGLAWRGGELFATDNGPDCNDEINRIQSGANYGWREGQPCDDNSGDFEKPLYTITPTVGITELEFYAGDMFPELQGNLFVGDYVTGSLRRFALSDSGNEIQAAEMFVEGNGDGVLDIQIAPDGAIYFSTVTSVKRIVRPTPEISSG